MPVLKLSLDGLKEVEREFSRQQRWNIPFYGKLEPSQFFEEQVAPLVLLEIKRMFQSEGASVGSKWKPVKKPYFKWKQEHGTRKTTLRLRDHYFRAATQLKGPGSFLRATNQSLTIGVDSNYFSTKFGFSYPLAHELGLGSLPERPIYSRLPEINNLEQKIAARVTEFFRYENRASLNRF